MNILVHGMQSSGASLFAWFLGQAEDSLVIPDITNYDLAPDLSQISTTHKIVKTVITTTRSLESHQMSFKPDRTLLFVRNPYVICSSLKLKDYRDQGGTIKQKLRVYDKLFEQNYDIIFYEDFITDREGTINRLQHIIPGLGVDMSFYELSRSPDDIFKFNRQLDILPEGTFIQGSWVSWNFGHIRVDKIDTTLMDRDVSEEIINKVRKLCPSIVSHYEGHYGHLVQNSKQDL